MATSVAAIDEIAFADTAGTPAAGDADAVASVETADAAESVPVAVGAGTLETPLATTAPAVDAAAVVSVDEPEVSVDEDPESVDEPDVSVDEEPESVVVSVPADESAVEVVVEDESVELLAVEPLLSAAPMVKVHVLTS